MAYDMEKLNSYIDANQDRFISELQDFLRIPVVAAQNLGQEEGGRFVLEMMKKIGCENAQMLSAGGPPVIIGSIPAADPENAKTLLFYGHYDVQPAEPFDKWISPPFEANIIDGDKIIARGATDDKGGMMAFIKAAESWLKVYGNPPLNLKFMFEGEEEIGSPHLDDFMIKYGDLLEADAIFSLDGGVDPTKLTPEIDMGLKGMLYVEMTSRTATRDNYSGEAALVDNPVWELVQALATMKDNQGNITIDGWYDDYQEPDEDDIALIRKMAEETDEQTLLNYLGVKHFAHNRDMFDVLMERYYGSSATINGIISGYTGEGAKTIVPAEATVKIDFRLPSNMDDKVQLERLMKHLEKRGFGDIEVRCLSGRGYPYKVPVSTPLCQAVKSACEEVFGAAPVIHGMTEEDIVRHYLKLPVAMTGFGPADCNLHAPNEYMSIKYFMRGVKYAALIMQRYAEWEGK